MREFWACIGELLAIELAADCCAAPPNCRGLSEFTCDTTPLVLIADQVGQKRNAPFEDNPTLARFAEFASQRDFRSPLPPNILGSDSQRVETTSNPWGQGCQICHGVIQVAEELFGADVARRSLATPVAATESTAWERINA